MSQEELLNKIITNVNDISITSLAQCELLNPKTTAYTQRTDVWLQAAYQRQQKICNGLKELSEKIRMLCLHQSCDYIPDPAMEEDEQTMWSSVFGDRIQSPLESDTD